VDAAPAARPAVGAARLGGIEDPVAEVAVHAAGGTNSRFMATAPYFVTITFIRLIITFTFLKFQPARTFRLRQITKSQALSPFLLEPGDVTTEMPISSYFLVTC
jgi:hypothetical protein